MKPERRARHEHVLKFNAKVVRSLNLSMILNLIREQQPISRARIAQLTNLNKSTVSSIVQGLLDERLLDERIEKQKTVGRNPISLRLKTSNHFFAGIYFDSVTTKIAIIDINGTVKESADLPTEISNPEKFVEHCLGRLDDLRRKKSLPSFTGIGISIAGIVDTMQSKVVFAPNLGWSDLDITAIVRRRFPDVPAVSLENDAKASAIVELWFGRHDIAYSNFVFLLVDRGIGAAIIIDRKIIYGASHAAGEFGHTTLIEGGEPCTCGNAGCWEAYASDRATIRRFISEKRLNGDSISRINLNDIIDAAREGDKTALDELIRHGYYLGLGIANIIKSVDPAAIVICGQITKAWEIIYPKMKAILMERAFFGNREMIPILPASFSPQSPILGAATISVQRFFAEYGVNI